MVVGAAEWGCLRILYLFCNKSLPHSPNLTTDKDPGEPSRDAKSEGDEVMDLQTLPLYYFCSVAGLVMVIGGIWLVAKEKLYVDRETKEVTTVELPFGVKLQTNIPALALFLLGFVPLIYPLYATSGLLEEVQISGQVAGDDFPVEVYAVVESESLRSPGQFLLKVPDVNGQREKYKVLYVAGGAVHDSRPDLQQARNGVLPVPPRDIWLTEESRLRPELSPVPAEFR